MDIDEELLALAFVPHPDLPAHLTGGQREMTIENKGTLSTWHIALWYPIQFQSAASLVIWR